jgi:hypothetical protein
MTAGMFGLSAAIPTYHFFAQRRRSIASAIEHVAGYYQCSRFGSLAKYGTYTGGAYFSRIAQRRRTTSVQVNNGFLPGVGFFSKQSQVSNSSPAFVSLTVDAETGWHWSDGYNQGRDAAKRYVQDNFARYETTLIGQPNSLNDSR